MPNHFHPLGRALPSAALAFFLALSGANAFAQGAGASSAKPWYADGLRKLGFSLPASPEPIGEVSFQSLGGGTVKLSELRGKVVLLNFWATWCPPCRAEMPALDELWKRDKGKAFVIVGVSVGEAPKTVKDFIGKQGYGYPIFVDPSGELGSMFGARSIPTTYVIDKAGAVIAGKVGGAEYDSPEAVSFFAQLADK